MPSKSWELAIGGRRIEVSIGNLAIYTPRGGVDPTRSIPVMLDVGTDRKNPLDDPTYIGNRHARIPGERYDAFIDAYIRTVSPSGHSGEGSP
jgi:malate dehydrogenase (oxaloacetate-decarboxylating)